MVGSAKTLVDSAGENGIRLGQALVDRFHAAQKNHEEEETAARASRGVIKRTTLRRIQWQNSL